MTNADDFRQEQRGVAVAMAGALIASIIVLGCAAIADGAAPSMAFVDRLQRAVRADLLVIAWLAAAIGNVARLRFFSPQDIGDSAGTGSDAIRVAVAILQNTLEQAVLAVGAHMIVAATFSRSAFSTAALVGLFGIGRALFWLGYHRGAKGRAFGFALTFYPSVLALLAAGAAILARAI